MKKPIDVFLLPQAEEFVLSQEDRVQEKILRAFDMTRSGFYGLWFKKMAGTDGLFEFRVKEKGSHYRLFAFWDKRGEKETLIVCTHGIVKKTDKAPTKELSRAKTMMDDYFKN